LLLSGDDGSGGENLDEELVTVGHHFGVLHEDAIEHLTDGDIVLDRGAHIELHRESEFANREDQHLACTNGIFQVLEIAIVQVLWQERVPLESYEVGGRPETVDLMLDRYQDLISGHTEPPCRFRLYIHLHRDDHIADNDCN